MTAPKRWAWYLGMFIGWAGLSVVVIAGLVLAGAGSRSAVLALLAYAAPLAVLAAGSVYAAIRLRAPHGVVHVLALGCLPVALLGLEATWPVGPRVTAGYLATNAIQVLLVTVVAPALGGYVSWWVLSRRRSGATGAAEVSANTIHTVA